MFELLSKAEVDYEVFLAGLHPEHRERTDQIVQHSLDPASGGRYDIEYRTIGLRDGVERWVAARGQAFFDEAGLAVSFVGTVLNMTERKRAEEARCFLVRAGRRSPPRSIIATPRWPAWRVLRCVISLTGASWMSSKRTARSTGWRWPTKTRRRSRRRKSWGSAIRLTRMHRVGWRGSHHRPVGARS